MSDSNREKGTFAAGRRPGRDTPPLVAGYRLLRKIAEGGMSSVYQSYDAAANRPVAVKLLAEDLSLQPEFVSRFYREAQFSQILEHPCIVRGYTSGFDPVAGKHYLVLEYISGPSAHRLLVCRNRLPLGIVVKIGIDIGRALEYLHSQGYVHRDVKPDNVLLVPGGVAKLADLGLAKRLHDNSQQLTSVNQGVGTSYYMPYEQAINANLVDGRSDIFALGATLYHLLTGDVPYVGATHEEVIRQKQQENFRPVRDANPDVPQALADVIETTLVCDPRRRVQRATDLVRALLATQLAVPLPAFAEVDSEVSIVSLSEHDLPTRADFKVPSFPSETRSSSSTTDVSARVAAGEAPVESPCRPRRSLWRSRRWLWTWGIGAFLLALFAYQFWQSCLTVPRTESPPSITIQEVPIFSDGPAPPWPQ